MDVVALGELLIDFSSVSLAENGYPVMQANPGGAPANYLAALAKYGCSTAFIGKIGDDIFGSLLEKTLKDKKIDTRGVIRSKDFFTTLAFVTFDAGGDRSFSFARKPGADASLTFEEVDTGLIGSAKVLHFGSVSMTNEPAASATKEAVKWAKTQGKLISFDPNLREPLWNDPEDAYDAMLWGIKMADVVKISDMEVEYLWNADPQTGAKKMLEEYDVKLALVTLGPKGCHFRNKNGSGSIMAPAVNTIDTTGAGDIFGGSVMSRIIKSGKRPEDLDLKELSNMVTFASAAASLSTERPGGIESVPDEAEVMEKISDTEGL